MTQKRKQFWVDAPLQLQMLGFVLILVSASILLFCLSVRRGIHEASAQSRQIFHSIDWIDQTMLPPMILSGITAILASAIVTLLWTHRFAGPLRVLAAGMHRLKKGDFSTALRLRDTDTLKELVSDFSHMQDGLGHMIKADRERLAYLSQKAESIAQKLPEGDAGQEELHRLAKELKGIGSHYQL